MATASSKWFQHDVDYPSGDGKPMAETPIHRQNLTDLIDMIDRWFAGNPSVYVSGNMFLYYEAGNKHKHVSPDVFAVRGVPRDKVRDYYLTWEEGKGPDLVIELTSRSTKEEDLEDKFRLYQDVLRVPEYFLFDPHAEYLKPPLQGFRLQQGRYVPIARVKRRLPSEVLGLHLERHGKSLRLYDPVQRQWVLTTREVADQAEGARQRAEAARQQAEAAQQQAEAGRQQAEAARQQAETTRQQAEAENERLRHELEELRRRLSPDS